MKTWRFHRNVYDPFDTTGAYTYGGRWNPRGTPVLYTSLTYAGGLLELLAHASAPRRPPRNHIASLIDVPDDGGVVIVESPYLPAWENLDDYSTARELAASWLETGQSLCLEVPSVPGAPIERNLVINARHPAFGELKVLKTVEPVLDPRIWG